MAGIKGIGGVFLVARDRSALAAWYHEKLGIDLGADHYTAFTPVASHGNRYGMSVFSLFEAGTPYMAPSTGSYMLNFMVDDLHAFIAILREREVTIVGDIVEEAYGKFGWILDPEGNKIELWEPPESVPED